ncbi:hypothetical protein CapIbe_007275 [Capra ibex]
MEEDADAGGKKTKITGYEVLRQTQIYIYILRAPLSDKNIDLNGIIQYPRKPSELSHGFAIQKVVFSRQWSIQRH